MTRRTPPLASSPLRTCAQRALGPFHLPQVLALLSLVLGSCTGANSAAQAPAAQAPGKQASKQASPKAPATKAPQAKAPTTKAPQTKAPVPATQQENKKLIPPAATELAARGVCAIGVGVGAPLDYEIDVTFADAIKVARAIEPAPGVASDENGWLKGDGAIFVWASGPGNNTAGMYKLQYDGRAEVEVHLGNGTVGPEQHTPATNTSTRDVKLDSDQSEFKLSFSKTTAGVRNVKFMRPVHPGANTAHSPSELWYRPMKQVHQRFQWIRTMDFTSTNGQNVVSWADRTRPGRWSQQNLAEGTWWQGRGAAWEYAVHMANEAQKDLWISVPLLADDDYVRKLALLIHYGSDGKNPYDKPQERPVWAPLNPRLKLYLEYSNEVWNFAFPQWVQLLEGTKAEVAKGKSNLNFDGDTFDGTWNTRRWVRRIVEISTMFRKEFGDEAMMTRIRPLFETQVGWADNYLWQGLWFLDAWFNNGDGKKHVSQPRPVNYYIWGAGGSTYAVGFPEKIDQDPKLTVAQIFKGYQDMDSAWSEGQKRDIDFARAFGLKRISYEGGPGLDSRGEDQFAKANAAKAAAQTDARIHDVYAYMLRRYAELGGDGFTNFLTVNPSHGVLPAYRDARVITPKARALDAMLAAPRPKPTWGVALPATLLVGRYRTSSHQGAGESDDPVAFNPAIWTSYTVRNDDKARFAVQVAAASESGNGRLNVWVDGNLAGTLAIPNTGSDSKYADSPALALTLEPGQHGIRLDGATGTFSVKELKVLAAK